ncbi:AAEL006852-PA [Aedes aegypti]|uniref:AAEL006852-PA n=1 Tax=Aedes aegypti TaxID=7159 RepID=Q174N6_AEDAE|nr:AAEL006852-PA [Aedes aegypti]
MSGLLNSLSFRNPGFSSVHLKPRSRSMALTRCLMMGMPSAECNPRPVMMNSSLYCCLRVDSLRACSARNISIQRRASSECR